VLRIGKETPEEALRRVGGRYRKEPAPDKGDKEG